MSTFDATSLLNQFHANLASITTSSVGAFSRSAYRFTLDKEPDSGPDGRYSIDLSSVAPFDRKWGTGENVCTAVISVRVAYARLGGDFGGGDRQTVNRSAASDAMLIADVCENPANYNSSDSGISVVVFDGFSRAMDLGKCEIWETRFRVTFRTDLHTTPVQDLMVASLITDSTTALSALSVLSLASGTGAVIPATATSDARLFFLDKENVAADVANGDDILSATGTGSPVWRESTTTASSADEPVVTLPGVMTVGGKTDSTLQSWFEADRGVTLGAWSSGDGPVVTAMADQGGRGSRNVTAVGSPLLIGASINGKPGIRTEPSTPSYLRNTSTSIVTVDRGARTLFFVGKARTSTGGAIISYRSGASGLFRFSDLSVTGVRVFNGTDTSSKLGEVPGIDIAGIPHIWEFSFPRYAPTEVTSVNSAIRLMIDGVPQLINTNGSEPASAENGADGFVLASREDATQFTWDGEFSVIGSFNSDLPSSFRTALRASLSRKYGIEVASPTTIGWIGDSHTDGLGSPSTGGFRQEIHSLHPSLVSLGSRYSPVAADPVFAYNDGYSGATSGKAVGAFGTFIGGPHWLEIMAANKPDIAHLMVGSNDPVADSITASQTASNVLGMVQQASAVSPDTRFIITRAPLLATTHSNATALNAIITAQGPALQAALTPSAAPNVLVSPLYGNVCIPPILDDSDYADDTHWAAAGNHQFVTQSLHPFLVSVGL